MQTVTPKGTLGDGRLAIPELVYAVAMTLSPDGLQLYVLSESCLFVFSRDASCGRFMPAAETLGGDAAESPVSGMVILSVVSLVRRPAAGIRLPKFARNECA